MLADAQVRITKVILQSSYARYYYFYYIHVNYFCVKTFDSTSCWTTHICASYDGISNNLYYPMTSTLLLMHVLFSAYKSGRVRGYMGSLAFQKVSPLGYEHIMLSAHSIKPRPIGCLRLEGIFYKYTTPLVP